MPGCTLTTIDGDPAPSGVIESSSLLGSLLVIVICSPAFGIGPVRLTVANPSRFCPTVASVSTSAGALACPHIKEETKIERATTAAGHTYRIINRKTCTYSPTAP